jgi:ADP-ribosylglycohydrolase
LARGRHGWDHRLVNATEALGAVHADRARDCLHGLALGDAFGETWFRISAGEAEQRQLFREVPAGPWPWTDDTAMALSLYRVLISCGEVRQDDLAGAFAGAYAADPYAIWCAARHLDDLEEALWATASAGGDVDTTCAIAAGIVAARTGTRAIPAHWLQACEPLPAWARHADEPRGPA